MVKDLIVKFNKRINGGNERSQKLLKNVLLSFGVKGGNIVVGLLLVPMTIDYVNPLQYGLWLTISSIVAWMSFFDIGLGNGLRNKLAAALAESNLEEARKFISTAYVFLFIISAFLFLTFCLVNPFIDWRSLLSIPENITDNIQLVVLIVVASFCSQFVVQTVNTVLMGAQMPAIASLVTFIGQLSILITIFFVKKSSPASLTYLVLIVTVLPLVTLIVASVILYSSKFKALAPSFRKADIKSAKSILGLGGVFFFIQIGALLLYQTDNIILTKVIGPQSVTIFNIPYKLFSVVTMLFTIVLNPYWSAFTDAYVKGEYDWMKINIQKVRKLWIILSFILIPVLCFFSGNLYKIWIGGTVVIPWHLSVSMALYTIGYTGMILNCFFLNGIGKLRVQLYLYASSCLINVPLGILLARNFGVSGVVLGNTLIMFVMCIFLWVQTNKILNRSAEGIWAK